MLELRELLCQGPCGQVKLIRVAVQRDGMGREMVGPATCDDCKKDAMRRRRAGAVK